MSKPYSDTLNLTDLLLRWKNELKNSSSHKDIMPIIDNKKALLKPLEIAHHKKSAIPALMGTDGCLPREMSLAGIISEFEKGNKSVSDFFAIFEKYYLNLLYKSQFKYNWSLLYEQQAISDKTSKLSLLLNSLCRKTTQKTQFQSFYYRGISIFTPSNKRLKNLKYWLESYFSMSFSLQYATPKNQHIESQDITRLSENNSLLGVNTLLGNQCSLYGDRIDILIEVKSITEYHDWREDSERIRLIYDACHFYYKMEAKFNIKIRVPSEVINQENRINKSHYKTQLGINAFLGEIRDAIIEISL